MTCYKCKAQGLTTIEAPEKVTVADHVFRGSVAARRCSRCGAVVLDGRALVRFEMLVAGKLAESGAANAEAFAYMRKAVGMRAADLAALLDVRPETISRWETGAQPVERRALAILGALVVDRLPTRARTSTLDRLRALTRPRKLPRVVRLGRAAA